MRVEMVLELVSQCVEFELTMVMTDSSAHGFPDMFLRIQIR